MWFIFALNTQSKTEMFHWLIFSAPSLPHVIISGLFQLINLLKNPDSFFFSVWCKYAHQNDTEKLKVTNIYQLPAANREKEIHKG